MLRIRVDGGDDDVDEWGDLRSTINHPTPFYHDVDS